MGIQKGREESIGGEDKKLKDGDVGRDVGDEYLHKKKV